MNAVIQCHRCERKTRNYAGWNIWIDPEGIEMRHHICPSCQTPEENAEAVIDEATIDYSQMKTLYPVLWPDGTLMENVYCDREAEVLYGVDPVTDVDEIGPLTRGTWIDKVPGA